MIDETITRVMLVMTVVLIAVLITFMGVLTQWR